MKLIQNLNLRQTQKLVMTQELKNSIELLTLSTVDLAARIQQELIENPLLEEVTNPEKSELDFSFDRKQKEIQEFFSKTDNQYLDTYSFEFDRKNRSLDNEAANRFQKLIESKSKSQSLSEYLLEQLRLFYLTREEFKTAEILISMIDKNGFIPKKTEEIANELKKNVHHIKKVLKYIHQLDPIGIGARDFKHSLFIQSKILYPEDHQLHKLIKFHLKDLEKLDYKKISKQINLEENEIIQLSRKITTLQPFPAASFSVEKPQYIIPDAIIIQIEGEFIVVLNDEWVPKISINKDYKNLLFKSKSADEKNYFDSKINSAKWLIRSINQRRYTLLKVLNCIVESQIDFFRLGVNYLKPLTLRDIAEKLDIHESTISRITSNKYVQTNWGVLELKWFFSSGLRTQDGERESSKKIQEILKNFIKTEDPEDPLSDQEIVELMQKQGIEIARRTIAKYRKILKILPANLRKRVSTKNKE